MKIEEKKVSDKKLLVTKSNKRCRKILFVSKDEKQDRGTNKKADGKWSTREAMDLSNSRLYH